MRKTRKRPTVGQAAFRACMAHPGEIAGMLAFQGLLRLAAVLPAAVLPGWIGFPLLAAVIVLAVIPFRFRAGETLRYCSSPRMQKPAGGTPYANWLKTGLRRWGGGLLWGLPFLACAGYFAYGWNHLPFNTMWQPVLEAARLVGQEPGLTWGLPVSGVLIVLFSALFAYGWWRGMPAEYLPVRHLGIRGTYLFVKRARRIGKKQLIGNAAVNALLTLPALAGFTAVLLPYILRSLPSSSNAQLIVSGLIRLLGTPLPRQQVTGLLLVFAVLYLPLMLLRKMRSAVLIRRLTRECGDVEGGHAAG